MSLNLTILVGHLGKDAEHKVLENGTDVTKFSMATKESYKDKDGNWQDVSQWHDIVCWRGQGKYASKFLKGDMVCIVGKKTSRKWTDKDGNTRYAHEVVAREVHRLAYDKNAVPKDTSKDEITKLGEDLNGDNDDLPF